MMNLRGDDPKNSCPTDLIGSASSEELVHPKHKLIEKHLICYLCTYFSDYVKGAEIGLEMGDSFYKVWVS